MQMNNVFAGLCSPNLSWLRYVPFCELSFGHTLCLSWFFHGVQGSHSPSTFSPQDLSKWWQVISAMFPNFLLKWLSKPMFWRRNDHAYFDFNEQQVASHALGFTSMVDFPQVRQLLTAPIYQVLPLTNLHLSTPSLHVLQNQPNAVSNFFFTILYMRPKLS